MTETRRLIRLDCRRAPRAGGSGDPDANETGGAHSWNPMMPYGARLSGWQGVLVPARRRALQSSRTRPAQGRFAVCRFCDCDRVGPDGFRRLQRHA
jgi:hypothetical protein